MSCLLLILVCELLTEFQLQLFNDVDRTHYKQRTLRNVYTVSVWVSSVTALYCLSFNVFVIMHCICLFHYYLIRLITYL